MTISKQAWDDLKDRLTILVPRSVNLGLAHRTYGNITLGTYPISSSVTELPDFPEIEIVMDGETGLVNRSTIISLIQQLLHDVNEAESLSAELVSTYHDLAVLEELGRILPSCLDINAIATQTGALIKQKIDGMGCCLICDPSGDWNCSARWGGAQNVSLKDTAALDSFVANARPHIVDRGPLPPIIECEQEIGSWCVIPIVNTHRVEGLIVLARNKAHAFTSNDTKLLDIIASQIANYILKIRQEEDLRRAEVLAHEVRIAGTIQESLLPKAAPSIPGYQLSGRLQTADTIGGDYYDHILDGDHLSLIVADVSGHSVPAALAMAMVRTALRAGHHVHDDPADLLYSTNQQLCEDLAEAGLFVSVIILRINLATGDYRIGCAGHPPILLRQQQGQIQAVDAEGMIFGFSDQATYQSSAGTLQPGESVLLYTDGITESLNKNQEMFGQEQLSSVLSKCPLQSEGVLNEIEHQLAHWSESKRQDDCTMISLVREAL